MGRFFERCFPNTLVVLFVSGLGSIAFFHAIPKAISALENKTVGYLVLLFCLASFGMFIWSWFEAGFSDPGSIENDLKERGILNRCRQGDIPVCLQGCKICPKCQLPMPPGAKHCSDCGRCHLRYDHHCGVIGQCVADKNFKPFALSFFYAFVFGVSLICAGILSFVTKTNDVVSLVAIIYGGVLGIMLLGFGFSFVYGSLDSLSPYNGPRLPQRVALKKFFRTLGDTWFEKLIPISKHTTEYAWPGIEWTYDNPLL